MVNKNLGITLLNLFGQKAKKSRNSHTVNGRRRGHGDKSSQMFPNITPNINAQKMPLLSHLLRSAWNPLETNCCSFPCSLGRTACCLVLSRAPQESDRSLHMFFCLFFTFFVSSRAFSCLFSKKIDIGHLLDPKSEIKLIFFYKVV